MAPEIVQTQARLPGGDEDASVQVEFDLDAPEQRGSAFLPVLFLFKSRQEADSIFPEIHNQVAFVHSFARGVPSHHCGNGASGGPVRKVCLAHISTAETRATLKSIYRLWMDTGAQIAPNRSG